MPPVENPQQGHPQFKSDVSQMNILHLERPSPFALPTAKRGVPMSLAATLEDTVNVLVLKVEFQPEMPDYDGTTGIGIFDLRSYEQFVAEEGNFIDPAPHGTAYFNSHMEALHRFWYFVSDKKLNLTWDIYPRAESASFRLPVEMAYYGSRGPWADSSIADRLGHFLIDAITFADSSAPEIDFSRYQSIIIFHAGSDQQNNIAFINDTPDDFYTGFIRLAEPISVDNGANTVSEALQVPETVSQDNRVNALNAVLAHEFGHQLGLVDLYNTYNFLTQVGDFSLMDNNGMSVGVQFDSMTNSVGGTVPVYPDAWSRAYLGFDIPRTVSRGAEETISAATLNYSDDEIIKVPVTDFEYFLFENRQIVNYQTALIADHQTGVILGPGYVDNDGLLVANGEYDLLAPGQGMLIWHVDEYPAYQINPFTGENNFLSNSLQWDKDRRFIRVVEADGIVDFGGNYYTGFGDQNDFFGIGGRTMFTPFTRPPSHTNLGADSHVSITRISRSDTIMTADIDNDWLMAGWPQMSRPAAMSDPIISDIDGNGTNDIIISAGEQILAWRFDGNKIIPNSESIGIMKYDSSVAVYPLAVIADCEANIVGHPVAVDLDGDGISEVAAMTITGRLYAVRTLDDDHDERADAFPGFPVRLANSASLPPIAVNFLGQPNQEILAINGREIILVYTQLTDSSRVNNALYTADGNIMSVAAYSAVHKNIIDLIEDGIPQKIIRISADSGTVDFSREFGPITISDQRVNKLVSGDIDRSGGPPEIIAICDHAVKMIGSDGSLKWSTELSDSLTYPALGDFNSDGYAEIVVAGNSKLFALSYNGVLLNNFPVNLGIFNLYGVVEAAPVLGDVDGDGNPDIVVGLPGGSIYAFNYHGDRVAGFPLPSSFGISRACALGDINSDNKIDLVTVENSGFVKAWGIDKSYVSKNVPWSADGGGSGNNGYLNSSLEKPITMADTQLPENAVYNYPNPARNSTTIRFYLNNDSRVNIDIFDFMGDKVLGAKVDGLAHVANEYVWDCSRSASGVYFCRVEAQSAGSKVWRMIKIAIAK